MTLSRQLRGTSFRGWVDVVRVLKGFLKLLEKVGKYQGFVCRAGHCGIGKRGIFPGAPFCLLCLLFIAAQCLDFETEALESGANGKAVALAKDAELADGIAEESQANRGVTRRVEELPGYEGEFGGENRGERVDELALIDGGVEVAGCLKETIDAIGEMLGTLPVAEAAGFPCGEVLLADGAILEVRGEDKADFREGIEPEEDVVEGLAVIEAGVERFANVAWQAGDFSDARHKTSVADYSLRLLMIFLGWGETTRSSRGARGLWAVASIWRFEIFGGPIFFDFEQGGRSKNDAFGDGLV